MNLAPPETLAWLEQFGFKASNGRKKHSFDSSNSSFDTYSFDDADKTIQPLGIGLRSTLGKRTTVIISPKNTKKNDGYFYRGELISPLIFPELTLWYLAVSFGTSLHLSFFFIYIAEHAFSMVNRFQTEHTRSPSSSPALPRT